MAASSCWRSVDISDEDNNTPTERAIATGADDRAHLRGSSFPTRASPSRSAPGSCPAPRALAYLKLMEKYQEFNPFKLFVYGAQRDHPVPQVGEGPLSKWRVRPRQPV